jgi:hypothetical protein
MTLACWDVARREGKYYLPPQEYFLYKQKQALLKREVCGTA